MGLSPELSDASLAINRPTDVAMDVDHIKVNTNPGPVTVWSPEILLSILLRTIPPYALLDTTLSPGENSAWCKTLHLMKSIVLVCRGWYDAGVVLLYENVCIRRCHQLESLRRTLTSSPTKNLGLLVKSLTIQCYIPEDCGVRFRTDLEAVIGCCTSLSTFAYNARFVPPARVMTIRFPAYITHFHLGGDFDYEELLEILTQLKETLLSFRLIWDDRSVDNQKLWPQLYFPSLQSLSITFLNSNIGMLNTLGSRLTMPSLERLTVALYEYQMWGKSLGNRNPQNIIPYIFTVLELHGGQLRQLNVTGIPFAPEEFKQALKLCPQLERVILHPSILLRSNWTDSDLDDFFHPNLRWIDVTHYLDDIDDYRSSKLCLCKVNLPALEHVRHFCDFPLELLKWLDEYSPGAGETEEFVIEVFQHQLDCREGLFVWGLELDHVLEDKKGGGRYLPPCSDESESSDSDSEGDSSSSQDLELEWTSEDGDYDL